MSSAHKLIHKDRRFGRGVVISLSRRIYKLHDLIYRVESETITNKFYSVIFKEGAPSSCNCSDYDKHKKETNNNSSFICKHMYALMIALENNTIVDATEKKEKPTVSKNYQEDDYSF